MNDYNTQICCSNTFVKKGQRCKIKLSKRKGIQTNDKEGKMPPVNLIRCYKKLNSHKKYALYYKPDCELSQKRE